VRSSSLDRSVRRPLVDRSYRTRRRSVWGRLAGALVLVVTLGAVSLGGAIMTNAFGMGDRFDHVQDRIERFIAGPPPDRPTRPTVVVPPDELEEPSAEPSESIAPSAEPGQPTPEPTPEPVRRPVNIDLLRNPGRFFATEIDNDWCAVAGVQMVLAIHGKGDTSDALQREIASRIGEWESLDDSRNGGWGPAAMVEALNDYGVRGYEIRAYESRKHALRDAARAIQKTKAPVILLTWRGAHTWVMTGFRADGDPALFPGVNVSGAYILDPWYPRVSSIWGPSDGPGVFQDDAEMVRNYLRWDRPEGGYPDRDGLFIAVVPTVPIN
jgi:hypothetical protein